MSAEPAPKMEAAPPAPVAQAEQPTAAGTTISSSHASAATVVSINAGERHAAAAAAGSVAAPVASPFAPPAAPTVGVAEPLTDGSLARAPELVDAATDSTDLSAVREAVTKALAADGHATASMLVGSGVWTVEGAQLRIAVSGMGKKMLALTFNAAAEKIIRQELAKLGAPTRFMVVPGAAGVAAGPGPMAAAPAGSVQEAALAHPMVQRAKEIFNAEVRSVVDLRVK